MGFLADMAACLKAHKYTSRDEVAEHPVPHGWRTGLVVGLRKHKLGVLKPIALAHRNRQPDNVEEEVQHDDSSRQAEYQFIVLRVQVVHAETDEQDHLGHDPLHSAELDVIHVGGVADAENCDLRKQKVGRCLAVGGNEGCPCCCGPPSDDESKQTAEPRASRLSSPAERC